MYRQHLLDAGFTQVEIESKTLYTLDVLREKARRKDRMAFFEALENNPELDALSGSVIIMAVK